WEGTCEGAGGVAPPSRGEGVWAPLSEAPRHDRIEQVCGVLLGEAVDAECRDGIERIVLIARDARIAHSEDDRDSLRGQASSYEDQHLGRHGIDPLRIVEDAEEGGLLS